MVIYSTTCYNISIFIHFDEISLSYSSKFIQELDIEKQYAHAVPHIFINTQCSLHLYFFFKDEKIKNYITELTNCALRTIAISFILFLLFFFLLAFLKN